MPKKSCVRVVANGLRWHSNAQFHGHMSDGEKRLLLVVQPQGETWGVIALETDKQQLEEIFGSHSHKIIGEYNSISEAFLSAESFAQSWLRQHKATSFEQCGCEEIR